MASLTIAQRMRISRAFKLDDGYVLDFSNQRLQEFVGEVCNIDIYNSKYETYGTSKGRRMKALIELENDECVGNLLLELVAAYYSKGLKENEQFALDDSLLAEVREIGLQLKGLAAKSTPSPDPSAQFLAREIPEVPIRSLPLAQEVAESIEGRITEVKNCLDSHAPLAAIMLCGSILEGVLLGVASNDPATFNRAKSAPKDALSGSVKRFPEWTLNDLINVGHEVQYLGLDVKKHCHSLRDFRNYIHPNQQVLSGFNPDQHTAIICWQVLKAALHDIQVFLKKRINARVDLQTS